MARLSLKLFEDRLPGGADPVYLPARNRALYLVEGDATVELADGCIYQPAASAWIGGEEIGVVAGAGGARILRWELARSGAPDGIWRGTPQSTSTAKLSAEVDLDAGFGWLMRCDRVSFPKGGIAYTHIH